MKYKISIAALPVYLILLLLVAVIGMECSTFRDFLRSARAADETPLPLIPGKSRGNLHMHTTCSDGQNSYEEMAQEGLRLNMSFIAITDHTFGGSPLCDAVIEQCRDDQRLLCIPGMEVTGRVHLPAIGIRGAIDKNLPVKRQIEEIHRQGGLAIAAHPFREENTYSEAELFESGLDAVECLGIPPGAEAAFHARLREYSIPCVYNSDAHSVSDLAKNWTTCDGMIRNIDDLKAALKGGKCGR